jgi:hypothetical protein
MYASLNSTPLDTFCRTFDVSVLARLAAPVSLSPTSSAGEMKRRQIRPPTAVIAGVVAIALRHPHVTTHHHRPPRAYTEGVAASRDLGDISGELAGDATLGGEPGGEPNASSDVGAVADARAASSLTTSASTVASALASNSTIASPAAGDAARSSPSAAAGTGDRLRGGDDDNTNDDDDAVAGDGSALAGTVRGDGESARGAGGTCVFSNLSSTARLSTPAIQRSRRGNGVDVMRSNNASHCAVSQARCAAQSVPAAALLDSI